ncbi:hypothetical protein ACW9HM_23480 [Nocardia gipuzkoensis]
MNTTISIRVTTHTNHNLDTDDSPRTSPQPIHRDTRPAHDAGTVEQAPATPG